MFVGRLGICHAMLCLHYAVYNSKSSSNSNSNANTNDNNITTNNNINAMNNTSHSSSNSNSNSNRNRSNIPGSARVADAEPAPELRSHYYSYLY